MHAVNKMNNMYVLAITRMSVRFEPVIPTKGWHRIHALIFLDQWCANIGCFLCGNVLKNVVCRSSTYQLAKPGPLHMQVCWHVLTHESATVQKLAHVGQSIACVCIKAQAPFTCALQILPALAYKSRARKAQTNSHLVTLLSLYSTREGGTRNRNTTA
jgi:hypothetical protein